MATYPDANGVKLITTGDEAGTWGSSTNVNLQILDRAANGFESIALSSTSYTLALSAQPSSAENGHYKAIKFTGSPGGTCTVTLAQNDKARMYMLLNSTNQALIITQGYGGNVTLEVGKGAIVLADGAGSGAAVTDFTAAVQNVTDLSSPFNVGATSVATSGAELNLLDGSGAGTIANSKAVIYGSSGEVNATTLQLSGTSITATAAELNYVDGVTSAIQTQIDGKQATITGAATTIDDADLTGSRALISNGSGKVAVSAVTTTELGYLDGVTSAIQTQIDSKQGTLSLTANRALISDSGGSVSVSPVTNTEVGYLAGVTSAIQTQIDSKQATITGAATTIDDADLTASRAVISNASGKVAVSGVTTTELDILDGLTATTAELNIMDGVTASTAELNIMDGVTATTAELNIMDGVTATTAELNYVDGVTSAVQTQIDGKQATITGAASSITSSNLTALRTLYSDASGKVAASSITATELSYLGGVTSAIQTQLNGKLSTGGGTLTGSLNVGSGNQLFTNTVTEVTSGSGVTIDSVLLKDDTVTADSHFISGGSGSTWEIANSGTDLIIKYGSTSLMKLDSSGNLTVTGDIITNGTI